MPTDESSSTIPFIVIGVAVAIGIAGFLAFGTRRETPPAPATAAPVVRTPTTAVLTLAVVPKGTTHEFWKSIHAGAVKAERELDAAGTPVDLIWQGPLKEDDRAQQIAVLENLVARGVNGIVLAPLDNQALAKPVERAVAGGIPVVIIDSGLNSTAQTSFIATNNLVGGQMGAKRLAEVLGGKGKVLLLRYMEGSASTMQREAGFLEEIARHPGIEVVSSNQYAGANRDSAFTASQNLLSRFGDQVQGVFTPNESSTGGMILALKGASLTGRIRHVGFDASPPLVEALAAKAVDGLVVQDPFQMGYLGVKHLVEHLRGTAIPKQIDTPVQMVTPENMGSPTMKDLLAPPLATYLDG